MPTAQSYKDNFSVEAPSSDAISILHSDCCTSLTMSEFPIQENASLHIKQACMISWIEVHTPTSPNIGLWSESVNQINPALSKLFLVNILSQPQEKKCRITTVT